MSNLKKLLVGTLLAVSLVSSVYAQSHRVALATIPGCGACAEAEQILDSHHIKYSIRSGGYGYFPKFYVDGQYMGDGVDVVANWVDSHPNG